MRSTIPRILIICIFSFSTIVSAKTKHALLIGISNFEDRYWSQPLGSGNDLDVMSGLLLKQGFTSGNISLLRDKEATRTGIENAFKKLSADIEPGDVVVVQFSTHGVQIEDLNGDETDGLDEAVVCYQSAPLKDNDLKVIADSYLIDDEFGVLIGSLRSRLGPDGDLLVLLDYCHSGSSTRGGQGLIARGGYPPLKSTGFKTRGDSNSEGSSKDLMIDEDDGKSLSPFVIISAAQANQLDYEREMRDKRRVGALTYAMYKSLQSMDGEVTYDGLFSKISLVVQEESGNNGQLPAIEGVGTDRILFGGEFVKQDAWIPVKTIDNSTRIIVEAGDLMGLTTGSEVLVCPAGTIKATSENTMAKGLVASTDPFTSLVDLDRSIAGKKPGELWVFVSKRNVALEGLTVDFARSTSRGMGSIRECDEEVAKAVRTRINGMPNVSFNAHPDILIAGDGGDIQLWQNSSGKLAATCSLDELESKLQGFSRYRTMLKLETGSWSSQARIEIIPLRPGTREPDTDAMKSIFKNGVYELPVDTSRRYRLQVTSLSSEKFYVNILYLDPAGEVKCYFPSGRLTADECLLLPGEKRILSDRMVVNSADGLETFKVLLSPVKIDMRKVIGPQAASTRGGGGLSVLEGVFGKMSSNTRGVLMESEQLPDDAGTIGTFTFRSVEK